MPATAIFGRSPTTMSTLSLHGDPARFPTGLQELGEGVWAWTQPNGGLGESNAGLVRGEGQSLLVDTLWDLRLTGTMLARMAEATAQAPIRRVVNTHGDGDHCWGNQLLAGAELIGTEACARDVAAEDPRGVRVLGKAAERRRHGRRARPRRPAGGRAGGRPRRVRVAVGPVRLRRRGSHAAHPHLPGVTRARRRREGRARDRSGSRPYARRRDRARPRRPCRVRRRRDVHRRLPDHVERVGGALAGGAGADHRARPGPRRPRARTGHRPRGRSRDGRLLGLRDARRAGTAGGRPLARGGRPRGDRLARVRRTAVRGLGRTGAADRQRRRDRP